MEAGLHGLMLTSSVNRQQGQQDGDALNPAA